MTSPLVAQGARDSLVAGRRAYERAELDAAVRLLQFGLASGGGARDTVWVGGAHMLTDALLEQGKDTLAGLWTRWLLRTAPALPIDSSTYPPRVARAFLQSRAALGAAGANDSAAATILEPSAAPEPGRGTLRIARGNASALVVVDSVGTMLPGESRTIPQGTYTVHVSANGFQTLTFAREVLPGFVTVINPRLARPGAATPAASAAPGQPPATAAAGVTAAGGLAFAASGGTTCALEGGAAACWGDNREGQLGSGVADSARSAIRVSGGQSFQSIAVGPTHACALNADRRAYCWGRGTSGELGDGRTVSSATPVAVVGNLPSVTVIGTGSSHTCALTQSGAVYCWGSNRNGELGSRSGAQSATPVPIVPPSGVSFTSLAVGPTHSCALGSNGTLYCWGDNSNGQLGNGSTSAADTPVPVASSVPLKVVALGTSHTCALTAAGAAWCWGSNTSGQLGLGVQGPTQSLRPASVPDAASFASLAAGEAHTCGLTQDGAAYCWGSGRAGQLGNGRQADSPRPVLVVGGQNFRAIGLGASHSCGLAADGAAWCWGDNATGQLGMLTGRTSAVPAPVLSRPTLRATPSGAVLARSLHESFDHGNWTQAPAWMADSAPGVTMAIVERSFQALRSRGRLAGLGAGLALPVRIPVTRTTQLQFDVMVLADSARNGCGLNCATWPASVRVRVKNTDLTESEVWYVYGDRGGRGHTLGSVVIVAKGDVTPGRWLRAETHTIREALPRADTILQIAIGSVGADVGARFDNILVPVPVPVTMVLTPDNAQIAGSGGKAQLRAAVFDTAGAATPWVRVAWSSSDTLVARVDSTGLVTGTGAGHAVIRAVAGAITDSASVNVSAGRRATTPTPAPSPAPRRRIRPRP